MRVHMYVCVPLLLECLMFFFSFFFFWCDFYVKLNTLLGCHSIHHTHSTDCLETFDRHFKFKSTTISLSISHMHAYSGTHVNSNIPPCNIERNLNIFINIVWVLLFLMKFSKEIKKKKLAISVPKQLAFDDVLTVNFFKKGNKSFTLKCICIGTQFY